MNNENNNGGKSNPFAEELTPDNAAVILIDHQTGLLQFLPSIEPTVLKNNILGLAKTARAFNLPVVMGTSWAAGPNGPTMPELRTILPDVEPIERPYVNFWNDPTSKAAVEATGRKKLIIAGLATEVCVAFPAIAAVQEGYDVYAVIDASADWNPLVQQVTAMRLASAGVVVTTWVAVLAELARNTQENGKFIAEFLREHVGSYSAAWNNFMATSANAESVAKAVGT
jgi:nicotinamidase-related amidase